MRTISILSLAAAVAVLSAPARGADDVIANVCKAYGDVDKISSAKQLALIGVLKSYMGGLHKYDLTMTVKFPDTMRQRFEGFEGTYGEIGSLVTGDKGWRFNRGASRAMAPDEVASVHISIRDLDWLGRLKRGEQKYEPLPDVKGLEPEGVDCAAIKLIGEEDREVTLYFDKETWLLYRRDEAVTDRNGSIAREYVVFMDYDVFEGIQVATTRTTYVNQPVKGRLGEESFQLVQKILVDEFTFSPEIEDGTFDAPENPFDLSGLSGDAAVARARELTAMFSGRRHPDKAAWACVALASLDAPGVLEELCNSDDKDLRHFGWCARVRKGERSGLPEAFDAGKRRKKIAQSMGYPDRPSPLSVTYAGNTGVRIDFKDATVYINAFYQPRLFNRDDPAIDPRGVVQPGLLLFTHASRDIFDPQITADIVKRTGSKVVGPETVIALLRKQGVSDDQLVAVAAKPEHPFSAAIAGAQIKAFAVKHAGTFTKEGAPEHVAYVVECGGVKTVHFGHADEPKGMDADAAKGADVIFMPAWMLSHQNKSFLNDVTPRFIIPVRYGTSPGAYQMQLKARERYPKALPLLPGQKVDF